VSLLENTILIEPTVFGFVFFWPEKSRILDSYRTSRPILFGRDVRYSVLYLLARKNHKMHIAHLDRFGSVGRCAIFGFVFIGQKKSQDAHRTSRPIRFGWSMCDIRFCISWPEKNTRCISHISTIVANKKSHFRPSDEKSTKNVDKDAVNTKIGLFVI